MTTQMSNAEPVFSFCVKCMRPEVTEDVIRKALENIGTIDYIDFVDKHTTLPDNPLKHYKIAFIHMKNWSRYFENIAVRGAFIDKLPSGINYVYDREGHYFTLHENYNPKYKTDSYITYLEQELARVKQAAIENYQHLQNECTNSMRIQQQNHELAAMNPQLMTHNTTLQQQVQWLTSQYVPNTFPQVNNYSPSAPPYYQETHTQVSDTRHSVPGGN